MSLHKRTTARVSKKNTMNIFTPGMESTFDLSGQDVNKLGSSPPKKGNDSASIPPNNSDNSF